MEQVRYGGKRARRRARGRTTEQEAEGAAAEARGQDDDEECKYVSFRINFWAKVKGKKPFWLGFLVCW